MIRNPRAITTRALVGLGLGFWIILIASGTLRARAAGPEWRLQLAPTSTGSAVATNVSVVGVAWSLGVRPGDEILTLDGTDAANFVGQPIPSTVHELTFRDPDLAVHSAHIQDLSGSAQALSIAGAMLFAALGALVYRWSGQTALGRLFLLLSGAFATTLAAAPAAILGHAWAGYLTSIAALLAPAALSGLFLYFPRPLAHARRITRAASLIAIALALATLGDDFLGAAFASAVEGASWLWMLFNCLSAVLLLGLRIARGSDRRGLSPLLVGTAVGLAPAVLLNALPRILGLQPPVGSEITVIPVATIPISFAYSILRHQIFGLDALMRRVVVHLCGALLGLALFLVLWSLLQALGLPQTESALLSVACAALAMPGLAAWSTRRVDAWLHRPLYVLRESSGILPADSPEHLGASVALRVRQVLPVHWSAVVMHDALTSPVAASRRVLGGDGQLPAWLDPSSTLEQDPTEASVMPVQHFTSGAIVVLAGPRLDGLRLDGIQMEAMRLLARHVAPSFEAALLRERVEAEARFRAGLTNLGRDLAAAATVNDVLRCLTAHAGRLLNAEGASLWRSGPDGPLAVIDDDDDASNAHLAAALEHGFFDARDEGDVERHREWTRVTSDGSTLAVTVDDGADEPIICLVRRAPGAYRFGSLDEQHATEMTEQTSGALRRAAERELLEEQLRHRAFYDSLTGLPNRALFLDRVAHSLARGDRLGQELAVLFIDLDRFKVVNDSLGHSAGDQLLVQVGRRLRACLRDSDTIARLGGDEFTVLLEGPDAVADAVAAAERILAVLNTPFLIDGQETYAGASVGISGGAASREPGRDLLREADIALYRAKASGRGRYVLFEARMNHLPAEHLHLESDLHRAIERNELRVHYQPIFSLGDRRITGFEALVRWQHPLKGLIPPGHFIPLAEDTGLIVPIGRWVLNEACRQMRDWQQHAPNSERLAVSVNLSARQLQDPALLEDVQYALRTAQLDPQFLQLEITESVVMQEPEATVLKLSALKRLGIRLAVDDFGTGYSSLAYLKRFPIDVLKIDRAFVTGVVHDEHDSAIVKTVVGLARALGLRTTAEGIEEQAQWSQLAALGCDQGQGFVFARPLPPEAAVELLVANGARPLPSAA